MPSSSLYYTDLELPTVNQDGDTYGTILVTYFQELETKLKNLSDRINAAGVGSSSTLAEINRNISQVNANTSSILPDPYSGNYTTVATWPAFNSELVALGLNPPETASEIETFFSDGSITTLANFLNNKLATLESTVSTAETDLCIANKYSTQVTNWISAEEMEWTQVATNNYYFEVRFSGVTNILGLVSSAIDPSSIYYPDPSGIGKRITTIDRLANNLNTNRGGQRDTLLETSLPDVAQYDWTDENTEIYLFQITDSSYQPSSSTGSFVSGSQVYITAYDSTAGDENSGKLYGELDGSWNGTYIGTGGGFLNSYKLNRFYFKISRHQLGKKSITTPDTSSC